MWPEKFLANRRVASAERCMVLVSNMEVLKKIQTKMTIIIISKKRNFKFFVHEERGHGECITHKARKEASSKLRNRFWLISGRTGIWIYFTGIYFA